MVERANGLLPTTAMPWLLGAMVVALGYGSDLWLARIMPGEMYEMTDDLILGVAVGVVGSWWVRRRTTVIRNRLQRIAEINHLIRNELQIIVCSAAMTKNAGEMKHIENSAAQISRVLQELLGPDYVVSESEAMAASAAARTGTR